MIVDEATQYGPFRVLVFQEEGAWIAQGVDYDICVQAPDRETLRRRFWKSVAGEIWSAEVGESVPFAFGAAVPERFVHRYARAEEHLEKARLANGDGGASNGDAAPDLRPGETAEYVNAGVGGDAKVRIDEIVAIGPDLNETCVIAYRVTVKGPRRAAREEAERDAEVYRRCLETPRSGDGLTHANLVVACRNIGFDLTCGACAALFYTGFGGEEHEPTCNTRSGGLEDGTKVARARLERWLEGLEAASVRCSWQRVADVATDIEKLVTPAATDEKGGA